MSAPTPSVDIPAAVVRADRVHHSILKRIPFSRHLNPINASTVRRAFMAGRTPSPDFAYLPLLQADDIIAELDSVEVPRDHPAGALVGACLDGTRAMVRALRDRSPDAFNTLARLGGWYPDRALLALRFPMPPPDLQTFDIGAADLIAYLQRALHARGMDDWRIEADRVMAARVLVDGAKRLLRVNPDSRFRPRDQERLVAHEIDVHAWRTRNGEGQILHCFQTGLPGSLATEEGLAMHAEARVGLSSPGVLFRQVEVVRAIDLARRASFRDVYDDLLARVSPSLAWGICLRVKRGLAHPELAGVYAKDSVYLKGWKLLGDWLATGGKVEQLYVGKVGTHHPVSAWLDQGWVHAAPVPPLWSRPPADRRTEAQST